MILIALIITIIGIAYIVSPIDIIPDFIPGVGWIDDLAVVIFIGFTWAVVLGAAIIQALMPVVKILIVVIAIIYGIKILYPMWKKKGRKR